MTAHPSARGHLQDPRHPREPVTVVRHLLLSSFQLELALKQRRLVVRLSGEGFRPCIKGAVLKAGDRFCVKVYKLPGQGLLKGANPKMDVSKTVWQPTQVIARSMWLETLSSASSYIFGR